MAPLIDDLNMDMDLDSSLSSHDHKMSMANVREIKTPPLHTASRRCVSFASNVATYEVLNRDDYTPDEIKSSWYDRVDLRNMKDNAKSEAKLVESGILTESNDVSFRGLEARTKDGARRKRHNRLNAISAIFFELDSQEENGIYDDEAVADVYFTYSEHCQVSAYMLGMRDAKEARKALESMKSDFFGTTFCRAIVDLSTSEGLISSAA